MKKLLALILLVMLTVTTFWATPAMAGDATKGAAIFGANCASCHMGGKNVVNAAKTLQKADLDKYGMNSLDAIKTQVTKGKNAMPSFSGRLTAEQIEDVATYVLAKSEAGWK